MRLAAWPAASRLISHAWGSTDAELTLLPGGANNRVFRVGGGGRALLLKAYFSDPGDARDRLGAEFGFVSFAWDHGVHTVPRAYAFDRENRLGLYEYAQGRRLQPGDIGEVAVAQATAFFRSVNKFRNTPGAGALPAAAEACFSVEEHLRLVASRVERLAALPIIDDISSSAVTLVAGEIRPLLDDVTAWTRRATTAEGMSVITPLTTEQRCLSPSDFGFHNALLEAGGRLRFLDFEYSGWDDPAKMVCDFFWQPEIPAGPAHYDRFLESALDGLPEPGRVSARARLLHPLYGIKWCCIILNGFLPTGARRRAFATSQLTRRQGRVDQLAKAQTTLKLAEFAYSNAM